MEMKFGKHRGKQVDELPTDYLEWMLNKLEPTSGNFDNKPLLDECKRTIECREKHGDDAQNTGTDGFQEPPAF